MCVCVSPVSRGQLDNRIQKQIQINTMCVCISLSAYVTLFCLFSPKVSIILLHPDKNVRKLTMNSATYKRPFKPVSSMASLDGRYANTAGGVSSALNQTGQAGLSYNGLADAHSGGLISNTSNVLNLGECRASGDQQVVVGATRRASQSEERECVCCCLRVGLAASRRKSSWRELLANCGPTCCWLALRRWLSQCCSVGELGATTALELESTDAPTQS